MLWAMVISMFMNASIMEVRAEEESYISQENESSVVQEEPTTVSDVVPTENTVITHTCSQCSGDTFQPLTVDGNGNCSVENNGKYYLVDNITISNTIKVEGKNVELCLNGKTLTYNGNSSIFYVYGNSVNAGTLTIHDCVGTGTLTGGKGNKTHSSSSPRGGAVYLRHATLNMYGGIITGNIADWGGAIFIDGSDGDEDGQYDVYENSTFNMYGGTIKNNEAKWGGGAVEVENVASSFNMYGGEISGNKVKNPNGGLHKGGGVHFAAGRVKIEGKDGMDIIIKDNEVYNEDGQSIDNNLYFRSDKVIDIINRWQMGAGSSIGVSSSDIEGGSEREIVSEGYGRDDSNRKFVLDGIHLNNNYALVHEELSLYIIKLPFVISTQPENVTVNVGENAIFNAQAEEGCSYQWQVDTNNDDGFVNISEATEATYTISNVTDEYDGYKYRCVFTKGTQVVNSSVAVLTVNEVVVPTPEPTPTPTPAPAPAPAPTPTPAPTEITVPASRENVVHITASISGETANVRPLAVEELNKVAKNETSTTSIEINLSETGSKIQEVVLPVESLKEISKIMDSADNKLENVSIKLSTATVEVSAQTLKAVLSKSNGSDLRLVVDDIHKDTLNDSQKEAVKNQNVHQCIDAYFISNGVRIGEFDGGKVTLRLPFNVPEGLNGKNFSVWYVADNGTIEKHDTKYVNGELVFTVTHFSDYVVVYDLAVKDSVPKTGESADYTTMVWTAILAIGVVGLFAEKKKRRQ